MASPNDDWRSEEAPDGKYYVDAVILAGQRSRAIISIVLILLVFTLTAIRNNYDPAWKYTLIQLYEDLHDCLLQNNFDDPKCKPLKDRIEQLKRRPARVEDVLSFATDAEFFLQGAYGDRDFARLNETKIKEIETRYNALIAKEATSEAISIPLLGSEIDYNDIWLVSGVFMFWLLLALYASSEQEYRNLRFIFEQKPQYADLVIMHQVLHLLSGIKSVGRIVLALVWMMPTYLYLYLFYTDLDTYSLSVISVGRSRTHVEYGLEAITVIGVILANIGCLRSQIRLLGLLNRVTA
jgi:hypothetical protein